MEGGSFLAQGGKECTFEIFEWHHVPVQCCWEQKTPTETPILLPLLTDGRPGFQVQEDNHLTIFQKRKETSVAIF